MKVNKTILVFNGASASEQAPNFIAVVQQKANGSYHLSSEHQSIERGGPERFPIDLQIMIEQGIVTPDKIDLIAIIIGPGSFTGLRASIAFTLGLQTGLNCPVIALRRGESLFPTLEKEYPQKLIWHVTSARRNRIFVENNQDTEVKAYDLTDIPWPNTDFILAGESVPMLLPLLPETISCKQAHLHEADAIMMAKLAVTYQQMNKQTNPLQPLYIDPPKASLPKNGLRKAPQ